MKSINIKSYVAAVLSVLFFVAETSATTCIANKTFDVPRLCGAVSYNSQPVAGATAELVDSQDVPVSQVTTGTEGQFSFKQIPDGQYVLRVKVDGFAQAWQPIALNHSAADGPCKKPILVQLQVAGKCSVVIPTK